MVPMTARHALLHLVLILPALTPVGSAGQSLRGSRASLEIQNQIAREHDFSYLHTSVQVQRFVSSGYLVPVHENAQLELHQVSFPSARPEVRLFVERLSAQYHAACGERLVVTSLTRPATHQPRNASDDSVHPTGMAVDLRLSRSAACRGWLERVLLDLERARLLEATRERRPAHYHIAVFPRPYAHYVASRGGEAATGERTAAALTRYQVRSGDTLWGIARTHGTTVAKLRATNALSTTRILPGQVLEVPLAQ